MGVREPSVRVVNALEELFAKVDSANSRVVDTIVVAEDIPDEAREFSFRLQKAFRESQLSKTDITRKMQVLHEELENWLHGIKQPKAAQARRLADMMGVRTEWLIRGEGLQTESMAVHEAGEPYGMTVFPREVGVVSWSHAGQAATYEEIPKDWREKVATTSRDRRAFGVVVEGDCMEPKYMPGDILILEPSREPVNGKPVVAKLKDDAVQVRIYQKLRNGKVSLASMKPQIYRTEEYDPSDFHWIFPVHSMVRRE